MTAAGVPVGVADAPPVASAGVARATAAEVRVAGQEDQPGKVRKWFLHNLTVDDSIILHGGRGARRRPGGHFREGAHVERSYHQLTKCHSHAYCMQLTHGITMHAAGAGEFTVSRTPAARCDHACMHPT
jgi:hypothetical protein